MKSLVGRKLGPYHISQQIGRGGMAVVYLGYHETLRQPVAIKVLLPHLTHDPNFVARFRREARVAASLQHPNIIHIHTFGNTGDLYYLVTDYADGGTLQERLTEGQPLDWTIMLSIARQVAKALDYAHSQGVVHRDVKPSNILLTREGQAILADFGIARAAEQNRLTLTGGHWGTPAYMAPEQALGQDAGPATDIYALGAIVYEMATGRVPFQADTPIALLHQQVYEPPPPPRQVNRRLPEAAEAAILTALAKEPADRFDTARSFVRALRPLSSPSPEKDKRRTIPSWLWALFLVSFLGLWAFCAVLVIAGLKEPIPLTTTSSPGSSPRPSDTSETAATLISTWTPSPWPSNTPYVLPSVTPTPDPFWLEIESLLMRYRPLKAIAIGKSHDVSQLPTVMRGKALKELEGSARWQRDNGAYYDTTWHWYRIDSIRQIDATHGEALVTYNETLLYYPRGWTKPSDRISCRPCEYQTFYLLEWIDGAWYIVDKDVVE